MPRLRRSFLSVTLAALVLLPCAASALSVTGDAMIIAPPPSAAHMQLESSDHAFVWAEQQGVITLGPTSVNVIPFLNNPTGFYDSGNAAIENTWSGTIPAGIYDSYFLHADKQGAAETFEGTITVPADIVAIVYKQPNLNTTDAIFGAPGTTYADGPNRLLELDGPNNWFEISADLRTLTFKTVVLHNIDDLRIITAHVPEPTTALLVGLGLIGLAARGRRTHGGREGQNPSV